MIYLDLDELDSVFAGRWLWSTRRMAVARFRRSDHFGDPTESLADAVRELVAGELGFRPSGAIRLLTQLRHFGYVMNPVCFYFCFDEDGETLQAVVAEVTNTPWGERHCYVIDARDRSPPPHPGPMHGADSECLNCESVVEFSTDLASVEAMTGSLLPPTQGRWRTSGTDTVGSPPVVAPPPQGRWKLCNIFRTGQTSRFRVIPPRASGHGDPLPGGGEGKTQSARRAVTATHRKTFHVSPFMPMDLRYDWVISQTSESMNVSITNHRDGERVFDAGLTLQQQPITTANLVRALLRFPLMTGRIAAAIYWQALRLWWKGASFHPHPGHKRPGGTDSFAPWSKTRSSQPVP